jgi:hypothetical protein
VVFKCFFFRGEGVVVGLEIWDCIKAAMQFSTLICCLPPPRLFSTACISSRWPPCLFIFRCEPGPLETELPN